MRDNIYRPPHRTPRTPAWQLPLHEASVTASTLLDQPDLDDDVSQDIHEYYYMVDGHRHSMGHFLSDMCNYPDFTVRQLLDYFSLEIADGREEYDDEEED